MGMHLDLDDVSSGHQLASEQLAEMRAVLAEWIEFAKDVQPGCAAGADWLDGLRNRTRKHLLAPNSNSTTG